MFWWIASYPKSGNTWMRMFLSAVHAGGEVNINKPVLPVANDYSEYFYQVVSPKPLDKLTQLELLYLRPSVLLHLLVALGQDTFIKTHFPAANIEGVDVCPPGFTKGAIYIVRDPRDIVLSLAAHDSCSVDEAIVTLANPRHMIALSASSPWIATGTWSQNVKCWLQGPRVKEFPVLLVYYEQMVKEPDLVFQSVLDFLGMKVSEDVFQRSLEATSFLSLQHQEQLFGFQERKGNEMFFRRGKAGAYKEDLTKEQISQIERDHGEMMQEMGYL